MAWIKRNLFFLIGSLVALILMAGGGFFLFQQITAEGAVAGKIAEQYNELKRLYSQNPHPGAGAVDNIKTAQEQEAAFRDYSRKIRPLFARITPIPDFATNRVSNADFAAQLRNTVTQLHHAAEQQSVALPQENYYFTFEAQKKLMIFDPASLNPMASHLGEIKAICDILFDAKVNSLDSIRREKISESNDNNPPDYLPQVTTSTALAELTPYEVTFKSFSTELALVLSRLASSPYGFVVKTINVEPDTSVPDQTAPTAVLIQAPPTAYTPSRGGRGPDMAPQMVLTQVVNHGPTVFLAEKPFKVTLSIIVVKLKPAIAPAAPAGKAGGRPAAAPAGGGAK